MLFCFFESATAYRTCDLHIFIFIYESGMHLSRPRLSPGSLSPGNSCMEPPSRNGRRVNNWMDLQRWYRWGVDCSIDRRLFVRTTPIFLMLLVQQEQKKKTKFRQFRGIQRLSVIAGSVGDGSPSGPLLASLASFRPHEADSYLCALPAAVDDKEK